MDPRNLLTTLIVVAHHTPTGPPDGMGDPTDDITYTATLGFIWQEQRRDTTDNTAVEFEQWRGALRSEMLGLVSADDTLIENGTLDDDDELVPGSGSAEFVVYGPPWDARNPRTQERPFVELTLRRTR